MPKAKRKNIATGRGASRPVAPPRAADEWEREWQRTWKKAGFGYFTDSPRDAVDVASGMVGPPGRRDGNRNLRGRYFPRAGSWVHLRTSAR